MKTRNTNTFRATLSGLKGDAFGVATIFDWTPEIVIYQARISPELWRARPQMKRLGHTWESSSAEALMDIINSDFVRIVKPWGEWTRNGWLVVREQGRKAPASEAKQA
jgi:hypothetical protein